MFATETGGHDAAARAIFDRHHEPLYRYLARLTGDPDAAADAAQEAFVRLLEQDPPPDEPRPWLFRVATNVVRDSARKRKRHQVLAHEGRAARAHGDPPRSPDGMVDRETARRLVGEALTALSPKERQALLMREEGFKHREIAEALGTTTGSIGTLLRRAIHKAAGRLEMEDGS
ncbi:MAG: sigma-70 family RNA polymerase sigma factor [Gemmatimonadetes bacterium]|nr:sigma-70 family RNA polymerase sigma factor [Gemmatimonadota bacterium]NIQ55445.1 sigma-70 family RNA polymerase sigma factor [Gemmatimonadota bacterium]NIU75653.1 sigma-70 family RNA polymerase sigma factor [Gammaproteobacteria bacterium]NIX45328.1 sigma-70 family RNA polymerase sigma factor [Gemmatimonadota bacterium]NIY09611.1 sigma-70 family RNA polymerase sigma factor [Gemmatimonadota bacterium]